MQPRWLHSGRFSYHGRQSSHDHPDIAGSFAFFEGNNDTLHVLPIHDQLTDTLFNMIRVLDGNVILDPAEFSYRCETAEILRQALP